MNHLDRIEGTVENVEKITLPIFSSRGGLSPGRINRYRITLAQNRIVFYGDDCSISIGDRLNSYVKDIDGERVVHFLECKRKGKATMEYLGGKPVGLLDRKYLAAAEEIVRPAFEVDSHGGRMI